MLAFVYEAAMQLPGLRYTGQGRDSVVNRGGVRCPSTSMPSIIDCERAEMACRSTCRQLAKTVLESSWMDQCQHGAVA